MALGSVADSLANQEKELTSLMVREVGKPAGEAAGEVARAVAILRYYAQQCYDPVGQTYPASRGLSFTVRRPRGAAGLITPWNFPLAIPVWKAAPALAYGNAALVKPSPDATACALRLAELVAGHVPDSLFTVLPGDAETGRALVDVVDLVSFTGSGAVGRRVAMAAAERGIPAQCEMGGLSASIVLPDADLDHAAASIAYGAMGFAGQKCTATKRVIVVGDAESFAEALRERVLGLGYGDPAEDGVVVGPVINEVARQRVVDAVAEAERAGGRLLTGKEPADGWFVRPTVVTGLGAQERLNREEVFGPICTLISASNVDHALTMANDSTYGLATALYTSDLDAALSYVDECASGMVKINAPTSGVDFHLPFGGEKKSGCGGKEQGKAALQFYTSSRTVQIVAIR
ncbi:aldehyde dehydrogenase [Longimycelium tulufanense]|uniref:Aldehyde dehydrogenase n=1 Tax=Longimycelium tulufanense TaxID=907463 RepID=A0A8J3C7R3_9PSEU|nr:aldehyde dehydrogenase [Longimycelium tulufanense]